MKPISVTRKNMNPGARIRSWWHRKKLTGIIIEGVEIRPCWWNFNSYCKQYVSSFEDESIIVKWDNEWKNQMGQNIETVPVDRCVFLEKITTTKERKRPDFDKMLKHWDNSDLQELYDYLDKKLSQKTIMEFPELSDEQWEEIAKEWEQKEKIKEAQYLKVERFFDSIPMEKLEEWITRFLEWETKYEEFWYTKTYPNLQ